MFRIGRAFMEKFSVPALSVAVTKNAQFVYEHQFGMADRKDAQQTLPSTLFRIASVNR
jgi:CubicO group peptidase (beta-lactamase class C family)